MNEDEAHACVLTVTRQDHCRSHPHRQCTPHISDNYISVSNNDENDDYTSQTRSRCRSNDDNQFRGDQQLLSPCQCEVDTKNCSVEFGPFLRQANSDSHQTGGVAADYSDEDAWPDRVARETLYGVPQDLNSESDLNASMNWHNIVVTCYYSVVT